MDMQSRTELISLIVNYFKDTPVKKGYVFGSLAKGDEYYNDIDLLVDVEKGMSLFDFAHMKLELEDLVNKRIDLVSVDGISERLKPYIDIDKLLIYERS